MTTGAALTAAACGWTLTPAKEGREADAASRMHEEHRLLLPHLRSPSMLCFASLAPCVHQALEAQAATSQ